MHWHAYSWTGHELPPDSERRDPAGPLPPLNVHDWLRKPARYVATTYHRADHAGEWLADELREHPRGPRDLPPAAQLERAEDRLARGLDVVWGYYAANGRYISRALIACTPAHCPYGVMEALP